MTGIKSYRPITDWALRMENEVRKQLADEKKTNTNRIPKQTSPRLFVPSANSKFPPDGTNRYLKAKRKQRITLAKVSAMDNEP